MVQIAAHGSIRNGVAVYIHPLYDGSVSSAFDMAIVNVDQPIDSGPLPILLSENTASGAEVVTYGYGLDQNGSDALTRIQSGEAPLKATYSTFVGYSEGSSAVVSTGEGATCPGDSGGPVLARNASGSLGIIGITRAGLLGCSAEKGRPSFLSSTQSNGAVSFITSIVPDVATN